MKNLILEYVNKANYEPKTFDELVEVLNIAENELDEFHTIIQSLLSDYEIFLNKKPIIAPITVAPPTPTAVKTTGNIFLS